MFDESTADELDIPCIIFRAMLDLVRSLRRLAQLRLLLCVVAVLGARLSVRVPLELVHRWEVIGQPVRGLAQLVCSVREPAVSAELAGGTIATRLGAEVGCKVLQLVLAQL